MLINGWLVQRFGQKKTLIYALVCLSGFIFIVFFAPSTAVLLVGWFLCGLPWGVFASSAPAYASEVLPLRLRIYLTSYTNMYVEEVTPTPQRGMDLTDSIPGASS